jgi:type IV secretion system protein VirD4
MPSGPPGKCRALLRRSGVPAFEQDALQFIGTNERTRTSITSAVMPALGWLTHPAAAAAVPGHGFDVAALLADRATVFLLGAEETQVAPLVPAAASRRVGPQHQGRAVG